MGYSKSIAAIKRVELYLIVLSSKEDRVVWAHPDPKRLTYALHQGMFSAKWNKYKPFENLYDTYEIKTQEGKVTAEPKRWKPERILINEQVKMIDENSKSLLDIIHVMLNTKFDTILFTSIEISDADYERLMRWSDKNGYKMHTDMDGLTIKKDKNNGPEINPPKAS